MSSSMRIGYGGANKLVDRINGERTVGSALGAKFKRALMLAQSADRGDDERQASQALTRFKRLASRVEDDETRQALKTAAVALQAQL